MNFFSFLKFARAGERTRDLFCYFHLFLSHLTAQVQLLTPVQFTFGSSQIPEFPIIKYLPFFLVILGVEVSGGAGLKSYETFFFTSDDQEENKLGCLFFKIYFA